MAEARRQEAARQCRAVRGIAIGIVVGLFITVAVGGNPDEQLHRRVLVLAAVAVTIAVTYAGRRDSRLAEGGESAGCAPTGALAGPVRRQPSLGSTSAASRSICSRWSNSAVNKMSSAPAAATWFTSRTQSATGPANAAASMTGTRCP